MLGVGEVLKEAYALLKAEATRLAGEPHDIPQRADTDERIEKAVASYELAELRGGRS